MRWIHQFQLFLFDFDGLLVNTEHLHFMAYKQMCASHGLSLSWDFKKYVYYAHYSAEALREALCTEFPALSAFSWEMLYQEKKEIYCHLVENAQDLLMPGVSELLHALTEEKIKHCVVTHSPKEQTDLIIAKHKELATIPFWITRRDYQHPKPHPEAYLKAISLYAEENDKIIGFEDSPRGFQALHATSAFSVLVSKMLTQNEMSPFVKRPYLHRSSFEELLNLQTLISD